MTRKRALGRGLDALIGARGRSRTPLDEVSVDERHADPAEAPVDVSPRSEDEHAERLLRLELGALSRGRYQPRREFDRERLDELAASIKHRGVMQPIVVRPLAGKGERQRYEIIAGERRWRAAQLAGLEVIPAVVRELDDESALALALIENIQREDLSAIDEALALKRLIDEFALTQQQVAEAVGKSRAQVANLLRLLALEAEVQGMLERGELDVGHARALLPLKGARQRHAARDVVARGLTVRQTESMVRRLLSPPAKESRGTADVAQLENRLGELLGAAVKIDHGASGKGKVLIKYSSLDELDGILAHIR